MVQTGDKVRFLNAVGGGKVIKVVKDIAYIEDEDGFEIPVLVKECVIGKSFGSKIRCSQDRRIGSQHITHG